jgi:hypothetical protein
MLPVASQFTLSALPILDGAEELDTGWYWSPWFGYVLPSMHPLKYGWSYHSEHGWFYHESYVSGEFNGYACWFNSGDLGWVYTDELVYPWFISMQTIGEGANFTSALYEIGSSPNRMFYFLPSATYECRPADLRYYPDGPNGPVPFWWYQYSMLDLSARVYNRAMVTVGQLKHIATQAREYVRDQLDLSPAELSSAFDPNPFPFATGSHPNNRKLANVGQAKFLSKGMYDLIRTKFHYDMNGHYQRLGVYTTDENIMSMCYPWLEDQTSINFSTVNQGQLKVLFGFDLSAEAIFNTDWVLDHAGQLGRITLLTDSNSNGVPDFKDADPFDDRASGGQSIGVLTVQITHP